MAFPAARLFDAAEFGEQFGGFQVRFDYRGGVEIFVLTRGTDGVGFVNAGECGKFRARQCGEGAACGFEVAGTVAEVAAEGDAGGYQGLLSLRVPHTFTLMPRARAIAALA